MTRTRRFFILFLSALPAAASAAAKVNFAGDWKMNPAKSEFGPNYPAPQRQTMKITHEDPKLKVNLDQAGERGEFSAEFNYTTDGKECSNQIMGNAVKSVLNWDGDALTFHTTATFNENNITLDDRWTLSEDGKTLTIKRHFKGGEREADQKIVLEKQ